MHSRTLTLLRGDSAGQTQQLLAEDVVFHSPVADYRGRADVAHILSTIGAVLDEIDAGRALTGDRETIAIVTASYRGRRMTGVLHEIHERHGRVTTATLLLRPLSVLHDAIDGMVRALERSPLPSRTARRSSTRCN